MCYYYNRGESMDELFGLLALIIVVVLIVIRNIKKYRFNTKRHKMQNIDSNKINGTFKGAFSALSESEKNNLKHAKLKIKRALVGSIVLILLFIVMLMLGLNTLSCVAVFLAFIGLLNLWQRLREEYHVKFFEIFGIKIINSVNVTLTNGIILANEELKDTQKESQNDYDNACFSDMKYARYSSQGLMNIMYQNNNIKIRNVLTEIHRHTYQTLYRGVFICVKCDFNLGNYISISTEQNKDNGYRFIVSNEFEKDNCSLVSNLLLSLFDKFYKESGINFEITYRDNNIYFRFFTDEKLVVSSLDESRIAETLYLYHMIIKFVVDFIEINKKESGFI